MLPRHKIELVIVLSAVLALMGCTHEIAVAPISFTAQPAPRQPAVVLVIPKSTSSFVSQKNRGTDTWNFPLGEVVTTVAPQAFRQDFRDVRLITGDFGDVAAGLSTPIVRLEIAAFDLKMGLFQWSEHEAVVRLKTLVLDAQGRQMWAGEVSGQGKSSGATQGIAYVPGVGNMAFDQALGVAMTSAVLDASLKASGEAARAAAVSGQPTP